ncbi:MAG: hypothetical protein WCA95_13300 [Opitutaceae bacterium]
MQVQVLSRAPLLREAVDTKRSRPPKAAKVTKRGKRAKITDATRALVKKLVGAGNTGSQIADRVGISLPSVQNIKKELGLVKGRANAAPKAKAKKTKKVKNVAKAVPVRKAVPPKPRKMPTRKASPKKALAAAAIPVEVLALAPSPWQSNLPVCVESGRSIGRIAG